MNNIFKFRAYDSKLKGFHYWCSDEQKHQNIFWSMAKDENMPISQLTGLKDELGNKMYRGDIIESTYNQVCDEGDSGLYRGEVHFRPSVGFMQKNVLVLSNGDDKWKKRPTLHTIIQSKTLIIGNVYESPEQLELESYLYQNEYDT